MILLFGGIGAITWAMRGSGGFGGFDGTLLPGFTWAILWYAILHKFQLDVRSSIFWIGIGIALGGLLGYGKYISWIHGDFYPFDSSLPDIIDPSWGWVWLGICGLAWGGTGGMFLGWSITQAQWQMKKLIIRISSFIVFATSGLLTIIKWPDFFFPYFSPSIYDLNRILSHENTTNWCFLMGWIGTLFETGVIERNKTAVYCNLSYTIGIGIAFLGGSALNLLYTVSPWHLDYWKVWELITGFGGGIGLSGAFWILMKKKNLLLPNEHPKTPEIQQTKGIPMSFKSILSIKSEKRARVSFWLSIYILTIWAAYGSSFNFGVLLGCYPITTNQYAFPPARFVLFLIELIVIGSFWAYKHRKFRTITLKTPLHWSQPGRWLLGLCTYLTIFAFIAYCILPVEDNPDNWTLVFYGFCYILVVIGIHRSFGFKRL